MDAIVWLLFTYPFVCCGIKFQTLCALVRAVYRKRLGDHGFDVINILIGFDAAEAQMQVIFYHKIIICKLICKHDYVITFNL